MKSMDSTARRQIRFEELPEALATIIRTSMRTREAAGRMPGLLEALRKADGGTSTGHELLVLHLAAIDIALQVDGRFNGLVHRIILGKTAHALADGDGAARDGDPAADGTRANGTRADGTRADGLQEDGTRTDGLQEALRTRLPLYLDWMYDFVSAQLDGELREPREVLGLEDPRDAALVIVALGEVLSLCHGSLSGWDVVA